MVMNNRLMRPTATLIGPPEAPGAQRSLWMAEMNTGNPWHWSE